MGVRLGESIYRAERVILAVGGSSYPAIGTTGDGWRWAALAGHKIVPLRAALAPLYLERSEPDWSGVALRDVILRARLSETGKEYSRWRGDLLFTHRGLSGPCALGISRQIAEQIAAGVAGGGVVEVDLAPDSEFQVLRDTIRKDLTGDSSKPISSLLDRFVPRRLISALAATAGIDTGARGANLPQKSLNRLVMTIKGWQLGPVRSVPLERGEVVAGGVSLDEVDPHTMRSRIVDGLYLCGEILDIAGPVGGYNLQAAWSTGYVAGDSAAQSLHRP